MKKFKILTLLFIALITFNCSSDDDSPAPEPTTHQLLSSGKWFMSSASNTTLDSCQREGFYDFTHTDTLIAEGFSTNESGKCESTFLMVTKYSLIDNDKNIKLSRDGEEAIISIEFISDSKLILGLNGDLTSFVKKN